MNMYNKDKSMKQLQAYSFAVYDALLYLDSHPDSRSALDYYNKYKKLEAKAMQEYEMRFGPVVVPVDANQWHWNKGPWPWQNESDVKE